MRQTYLIKENHPFLLLFFAGWGMDENPFRKYTPEGCDFMICYDYRTLEFDHTLIEGYTSVHLVAWSMGVWAASQVFGNNPGSIAYSIAVNGTPFPVHEEKGIAPAIFYGTLDGLNEQTLHRFFRRMCGSSAEMDSFEKTAPRRNLNELRDELKCIGDQSLRLPVSSFIWKKAIIGNRDKIYLPANQERAWVGITTEKKEMEHYSGELFKEVLKWIKD